MKVIGIQLNRERLEVERKKERKKERQMVGEIWRQINPNTKKKERRKC